MQGGPNQTIKVGQVRVATSAINRTRQTHVFATIQHNYKHGGHRTSDRNFHLSCFDKFEDVGRPVNPDTEYVVLESEER
jgi:hypothetical protein